MAARIETFSSFLCVSLTLLPIFTACAESVDVRLKDGLGKFNGRLEILHGNMWMPVSKEQWEDVNLDVVCKQVGRRNSRRALEKYSTDSKNFPYRLQCNKNAVHISECITENATTSLLDAKPLEITCKGEYYFLVFFSSSKFKKS